MMLGASDRSPSLSSPDPASSPASGGPPPSSPLETLRIAVLAATQSGNALLVADLIAERLVSLGARNVRSIPEGAIPNEVLADSDLLIACIASHGEGDVPDSFLPGYEALAAADLSHLRYGLIGLGDRTYTTFCGGAWKVDARLQQLGARRIGEVCAIDAAAQPFPDIEALDWLEPWLREV